MQCIYLGAHWATPYKPMVSDPKLRSLPTKSSPGLMFKGTTITNRQDSGFSALGYRDLRLYTHITIQLLVTNSSAKTSKVITMGCNWWTLVGIYNSATWQAHPCNCTTRSVMWPLWYNVINDHIVQRHCWFSVRLGSNDTWFGGFLGLMDEPCITLCTLCMQWMFLCLFFLDMETILCIPLHHFTHLMQGVYNDKRSLCNVIFACNPMSYMFL